MGIEPTRPAWKAGILPLNYTRQWLVQNCHTIISHYVSIVKSKNKNFFVFSKARGKKRGLTFEAKNFIIILTYYKGGF